MYFLSKINSHVDIDNNMLIIWIVHDKDFLNGSFYKIDIQNKLIYYCVIKNIEYYETLISNI